MPKIRYCQLFYVYSTYKISVYTQIKSNLMTKTRKYSITHKQIATWFNYSSERSFNSSNAKEDMLKGITKVIQQVENQLIKQLSK